MVTYKLHFIRHGMTDGNRTGRYVGRTDVPLCQEGRQELEALKQKYRYPEVQEVYCSPLTRSYKLPISFTPIPRGRLLRTSWSFLWATSRGNT